MSLLSKTTVKTIKNNVIKKNRIAVVTINNRIKSTSISRKKKKIMCNFLYRIYNYFKQVKKKKKVCLLL